MLMKSRVACVLFNPGGQETSSRDVEVRPVPTAGQRVQTNRNLAETGESYTLYYQVRIIYKNTRAPNSHLKLTAKERKKRWIG